MFIEAEDLEVANNQKKTKLGWTLITVAYRGETTQIKVASIEK